MFYQLSANYMAPAIRAMLSYNWLHHIPKDELDTIHSKIIMLFAVQIIWLNNRFAKCAQNKW